jgi:hypothetical protein
LQGSGKSRCLPRFPMACAVQVQRNFCKLRFHALQWHALARRSVGLFILPARNVGLSSSLRAAWAFLSYLRAAWAFLSSLRVAWAFLSYLRAAWAFFSYLRAAWAFLSYLRAAWKQPWNTGVCSRVSGYEPQPSQMSWSSQVQICGGGEAGLRSNVFQINKFM